MRRLLLGFALLLAAAAAHAQGLSASPSTVYAGQPVSAAWSGIGSPTSTDWIGLYVAGAADSAFVSFVYTGGSAAGSAPLTVPANTAPGSYELRLFAANGYTRLATSNGFSIQTPSGAISESPATVYSGQALTATWSAISAPTATDWVGLYAQGAADSAFVAYIYTDGNASGSASLTVPANTAPGSYELRLFSANGYQRLGTSAGFSIQTPTGAISASPTSVYLGQSVTAAWSAISLPTATDWVGLYVQGSDDTAFVALIYTDGNASGSAPLLVPSSAAAGTYELRLFSNNGYQRLGTSNAFTVQAPPPATLSVTPSNVPAGGGTLTAAWTNVVAPTAADWIGLYLPSAADTAFISWRYTTGTSAGNVPFDIAASVANGTYQLRLFSNNGYTRLATSGNFTVGAIPLALHFIEVDHLNTPRAVTDANQNLKWKWDQQEPFGVNVPDENPSGLGAFEFPVRFPGQYADRETGLVQNGFRDYWSYGGRYIQSDPYGLAGGLDTYLYALGDPLGQIDPQGLATTLPGPGGVPVPVPLPPPSAQTGQGAKGGIIYPPGLDPNEPRQKTFPGIKVNPFPPASPPPPNKGICDHLFKLCNQAVGVCPVPIPQIGRAVCLAGFILCINLSNPFNPPPP